ncbi:hypothetical protein B0T11DRAFT_283980 [Plectosphaerella cucumerina]|jgi:hypothetical protein|uniref:Uncharacterized protein n=1 Tax=Plectosphaerella cucumerina TaxID=40658 RepID=A0A8K0TGV5_9PEZI|nr:hypothetical protein B0T11DRAFT_283980 [Plectosphaerella cucumerina]
MPKWPAPLHRRRLSHSQCHSSTLTSASHWASGLHRGTASVLGRRAHRVPTSTDHLSKQRQSAPQSSMASTIADPVCLSPKRPSPGQRVVVTRATWNTNDWPSRLRWQLSDIHPSSLMLAIKHLARREFPSSRLREQMHQGTTNWTREDSPRLQHRRPWFSSRP